MPFRRSSYIVVYLKHTAGLYNLLNTKLR